MKLLNYAFFVICGTSLLFGCHTYQLAEMHPIGQYTKDMPEGTKPVHFVTTESDPYGNYLPAYLKYGKIHNELFIYPAPSLISVQCESIKGNAKSYGYDTIRQKFELGKTYKVYCETLPHFKFRAVAQEVDPNKNVGTQEQPTSENRVTVVTNGKDPNAFWVIQGTQITGIRNWDGKVGVKAELVGPRQEIIVFCFKEHLNFPVQGDFKVGKTYQVRCSNEKSSGYPIVDIQEIK